MTARYLGMNRNTGIGIVTVKYQPEGMRDILLLTPVGSRVMRREYGSLLSALIDMPKPGAQAAIMVACCSAIRNGNHSGLSPSAFERAATLAKCMSILPGCVMPIPVRQFQPLFH